MKKQFLAVLMALVMVLSMAGVAWAAEGTGEAANVASVGETEYATLQEAINVAESGDTIKLLDDITLTASVNIATDDKITLDLNGKALATDATVNDTTAVSTIVNAGDLTIIDSVGGGKVVANDCYTDENDKKTKNGFAVSSTGGSKLVIDGATIIGTNWGYALYVVDANTTVTIEESSVIKGRGAVYIDGGAIGTINGGEFAITVQTTNNQDNVIYVGGTSELTINDGTFDASKVTGDQRVAVASLGSSKVSINGGIFNSLTGDIQARAAAGSVQVTGGTFNGTKMDERTADAIALSGGTYAYDPTDYVAENYIVTEDEAAGIWTINPDETKYVAQVGEEKYFSIEDAIRKGAESGEDVTVTVLKDHTVDTNGSYALVYTRGRNVTLDLNGKTVTFDYTQKNNGENVWASIYVSNGSKLTVIGNGKLYNQGGESNGVPARIAWVATNSTMIIENGTYVNEQKDTMFYTSTTAANATKKACLYVKGGTFQQLGAVDGQNDYDSFNMQDNSASWQFIQLTGGTFNEDPRTGRQNDWEVTIPEGYGVRDNNESENKTYTIVPIQEKAVAEVNDVIYTTLADAVTAANAIEGGATVTLLQDVTLGEKLTISGDVTIEGEYTITRADEYTGTLFAVNEDAEFTLDGGLTIDGGNEWVFDQETYDADLANWEVAVAAADNAKWFTPEEGAPVATAYMITTKGTVNLNDVAIQNHYSTNGSGIVSASKGAKVTLDDAQIKHNASTSGSGLVVNASAGVWSREEELITVTMNDGTVIDGNHVGGNHGVFKVYMGTYFTMNGGEIKNTTGWNSNGVAVGIYHAVFTMNDGTICSNSSVYGPNNGRNAAIYGHSNHLFTMNDGTICHNTGRSKAGVDSPYSETGYTGQTTINNGTIVNNEIIGTWTAPDVSGGATLTITGGTYTQDVSQWCADGFAPVDNGDGTYTVYVLNEVKFDPETLSLKVGKTAELAVVTDPEDAVVSVAGWASDNESVATVDENGLITAVAVGTANITAIVNGEIEEQAVLDEEGNPVLDEEGNPVVEEVLVGGTTITCEVTVTRASSGGGGSSSASYQIVIEDAENGDVTVSSKTAKKNATVTLTVTADEGYELDELTVTDKNGKEISVTDKGNGKYTFTMPAGKVTVDAAFVAEEVEDDTPAGFVDVDDKAYYADAVAWAVENGVTTGTSATTFGPGEITTRAQTVTFLWRAMGEPEAKGTECPFVDVAEGAYYYDAVLWAVENGITEGTSATEFSPNETVTRAQTVTFLWRMAGKPEVAASGVFADVAKDAYYYQAVEWAVAEEITSGTSANTFSPAAACARAQIVTFLYNYLGK